MSSNRTYSFTFDTEEFTSSFEKLGRAAKMFEETLLRVFGLYDNHHIVEDPKLSAMHAAYDRRRRARRRRK